MNDLFNLIINYIVSPIVLITLIFGIMTAICGGNPSVTLKSGIDFIAKTLLFLLGLSTSFIVSGYNFAIKLVELKYPSLAGVLVSDVKKNKRK